MLVGIATFIVGSLACALAPNMIVLIVARARCRGSAAAG